jgi:hypothetical protein
MQIAENAERIEFIDVRVFRAFESSKAQETHFPIKASAGYFPTRDYFGAAPEPRPDLDMK